MEEHTSELQSFCGSLFKMSKVDVKLLETSIEKMLAFSAGEEIEVRGEKVQGKKRNFTETIELQIGLKNFDPSRDKRFAGTFKLPNVPRSKVNICVLGDDNAVAKADKAGLPSMSIDDMKKLKKNKKAVKKLANKYDAFLAAAPVMRQIPKLLGPGLSRAGKHPTLLPPTADPAKIAADLAATIKFQMKKVMGLNVAIANVEMEPEKIKLNIQLACNFLCSLLKKQWQNIKVLYIKSSMGPTFQIYF
eukprot:TRINITY_DN404361_c0_g1_i1.p2 TRINITY_DN404361_c0_g1~~TRINITY_DN404361_c0_g1_i1.p2  ORF type:complete len:247 (+),score=35.80 TRINITY_DN404361_c0_g1_i1:3-743(+)